MTSTSVHGGITVLPCAASATLVVRPAAARELSVARVAIGTWDATTGMKRAAFARNHVEGSLAWSPSL
ncbi:MAG: hypothetical protein FWE71_00705 [Nocardioidaceae bacterium]|nr:hypothetical protein [Nocardioidaceae bacterium]MCL2612668.1 hypothetical protein [Nocardioidaceae bacterium]